MDKENNVGSSNSNGNKSQTLVFFDKHGKEIEVECEQCQHCVEVVPKVGKCDDCDKQYVHWRTIEDEETGYLHFIYRCSGCVGNRQKAVKILKPKGSKKE